MQDFPGERGKYNMLRLNIRHQLPQTDLRMQRSRLETHVEPAQLHTDYRAARSNMGVTAPQLDINTYPSRHSYGFTNHTDFAKERAQQGKSDVKSNTSKWTREAWNTIDNAAKRGRDTIHEFYQNRMMQEIKQQRKLIIQAIPDPEIHNTPGRVVGTPDVGDVTTDIQAKHDADISYQPAKAETYIKDQGFLRQWTTEDKYDIYA